MARRGRRQVLQLDDVSSSHSPRPRGFAPVPNEELQEISRKMTSNPLLSLVGYASDASSDEDSDNDSRAGDSTPPSFSAKESNTRNGQEEAVLEIPLPAEAEPMKGPELLKDLELPEGPEPMIDPESPKDPEPIKGPEPMEVPEPRKTAELMQEAEPMPVAVESMLDIPLPESSGPTPPRKEQKKSGGVMESELANFFAEIKEIESISAEIAPPDKEEISLPTTSTLPSTNDPPAAADSSQPEIADLGFIPRPDASVSPAVEEKKPAAVVEEKPKTSLVSSAYQSMFVKGASEFVKIEKEEEKKENGEEAEEELPEEPLSEWQTVQDDTTGYYYYWNMVTNQVTWEIPPGYTQFLLLLKEYQERIAAIPKDKLLRMKEKKRQGEGSGRESSPAPSTSRPKKEKKHKRDKHRKEKSEPTSSLPVVPIGPQLPPIGPQLPPIGPQLPPIGPQLPPIGPQLPHTDPQLPPVGPQLPPIAPQEPPIGPQLPPMPAEDSSATAEVKVTADQSDAEKMEEERSAVSPRPSSDERKEGKANEALDSAVDSTSLSLPQDVEAIFDEALSVVSEAHADSSKGDAVIDMFKDDTSAAGIAVMPVVTSSSVVEALAPSMDVTTSSASVDSSKSISADSSKSGSPAPAEGDSAIAVAGAGAGTNTSVVSSSSVVSSVSQPSKDGRADSGEEGVVTNSGVSDSALPEEEEEDDLDMDFDDIDDLDRALEKALEKKLEKKKAELEKLESRSEEDTTTPDSHPLSSSLPTHSSQSDSSERLTASAPAEEESTVSSSVKAMGVHSPLPPPSSSRSSSSAASDKDAADSPEVRLESSRPKRSAAESSTKEEGSKRQEPVVKKARLVAYDTAETDEESMDASEEVSTSPAQSAKTVGDVNSLADVLPTPPPERVDNLAEIEEMASTASAKLAFLEVTVEGLTPLQTSLIALQTRMTDWQNGGLNGEYFYQRLKEVNDLLTHYESRAVPPGWTCQWDSNFRRYFYISGTTGKTQWEYPDGAAATDDAPKTKESRSKKGKSSRKKRSKVVVPEPPPAPASQTAPTEDSEATAAYLDGTTVHAEGTMAPQDGTAAYQDGAAVYPDGVDEDLDGIAMSKEEIDSREVWQMNGDNYDNQPSTSTDDQSHSEAIPSALQALFPGEPLPPGTELLLGLPPPPPPPLPADETAATTTTTTTAATTADDAYVCADDSSDEGNEKGEEREKSEERGLVLPNLDPDIDGEEMVEEEEEEEGGGMREEEDEVVPAEVVVEDPAVISRPPQLRFPPPTAAVASSAVAYVSSSSSSARHVTGVESSSTVSALPVLSAAPVLTTSGSQPLPDSVSSSGAVSSPKADERHRSSRSPAPSQEPSSSSGADHHKHKDKTEKHKKKKKEKLGSHTMSLKKKGVSTMVQNWQKVQKEVEKEERANQQRQLAIRQQLDEWKKGNS